MSIDWVTVIAQVVNFLVLVWLLKRFLYAPVLRAVAGREQRITDRLAQAFEREQEAAARASEYRERLHDFEHTRRARMAEIEREAEHERARLLGVARREVAHAERSWRDGLANEQRDFLATIRGELAAAVGYASARCIAELADAELQDRAIARLMERLGRLDEDQRRALSGGDWLVVASAFELGDERRASLERSIRAALAPAGRIRFEHAPQLLLGLELRSPGTRVQWSAAAYLREAEDGIRQRIAAAHAKGDSGDPGASSAPGEPGELGDSGGSGELGDSGHPGELGAPGDPGHRSDPSPRPAD